MKLSGRSLKGEEERSETKTDDKIKAMIMIFTRMRVGSLNITYYGYSG
jgi:hypothetical protein